MKEYTQEQLRDAICEVLPYARTMLESGEIGESKALQLVATPLLLEVGPQPSPAQRSVLLTAMMDLYEVGYFVNMVRDK